MKSVICATIIFIFIIIAGTISGIYVNNITNEMLQSLYKNEIFVSKNQWSEAKNETEILSKIWAENRNIMSMIFDHTFTDKVDTSIEKIKNAVKMQKKEDFIYERSDMELLLSGFEKQQKINVGNIF